MSAHTFNNRTIVQHDMLEQILNLVQPGAYVSMNQIAQCIGLDRSSAKRYVIPLRDSGKLVMAYRGGRRVYTRGDGCVAKRRESSIEFAGTCVVGRGLANW